MLIWLSRFCYQLDLYTLRLLLIHQANGLMKLLSAPTEILYVFMFYFLGKKKVKDTNKISGGSKSPATPTSQSAPTFPDCPSDKHNSVVRYDCLWPTDVMAEDTPHAGMAPSDSTDVYQLAKPLPPSSVGSYSLSSSTSTTTTQIAEGVNSPLNTSESIYHTPVTHPTATDSIHPLQSPVEKGSQSSNASDQPLGTDQGGTGKIYYLSTAVPLLEDPSQTTAETPSPEVLQSSASSGGSGINRSVNRGVKGGSGEAVSAFLTILFLWNFFSVFFCIFSLFL